MKRRSFFLLAKFRSKRRGFQQYIIGQLKECSIRFFKEDIFVRVQDDISSNECKNFYLLK
jgi:hypothetical protein